MANTQEKWQEIANRGLQDRFDPQTRIKFDEAVRRGLITMPQAEPQAADEKVVESDRKFASPRAKRAALGRAERDEEKEAFLSTLDPARRKLIEEQTSLDAFLIGAGKGFMNIGRGVGISDDETESEKQAFQQLKTAKPIAAGAGELAGETAPFLLPATAIGKIATLAPRVAATTALGAAEGGIIRSGQGEDGADIIQGAGLGGLVAGFFELGVPIVGRFGGKLIRKLTGKAADAPAFTADGAPSEELLSALKESGIDESQVTPETITRLMADDVDVAAAQARKAFLEEQGLTPTRAQVTGDVTDFQTQQELLKTSGRVERAIKRQDAHLASRFENAITDTGGSANPSNAPVFDFIADRSIDLDSKISSAYKAAREAAPTAKIVSPNKMIEEVRAIAGSDSATGGLASAAKDILRSKGLITGKGLKINGRVDAGVAEEIRKDLNALHSSLTPFGKQKLSQVKQGLDDDVSDSVGEDFFKEARSAKAKFESDLTRARVNKFDKRKFNLVRDIQENKINPDRFLDEAVLSRRVRSDDLEQLKRYMLLDDGAGIDAWNSLRAEALTRIRDDAFNIVGGEAALTRASLDKAVNKFGRDKLRVLLNQQERKFLGDLKKVSELREPKRGTALGRGPSAQAIDRMNQNLLSSSLLKELFGQVQLNQQGKAALNPKVVQKIKLKPLQGAALLAAPTVSATQTQEQ